MYLPKSALKFGSIYCVGRNYREHAKELGNAAPREPVVFLKSPSSIRGLEDAGTLAFPTETMHHEAELVVLIAKDLPLGETGSWQYVEAVALGLDLTRREVQTQLKEQGLPWTKAKSFAGAAVLGPFVAKERFANLDAIQFMLSVGGAVKQTGNTRDMLFSVPFILTYLAKYHPLKPGDLIYTGTPAGVGPIRLGDDFDLSFPELDLSFTGRL